ncbi:MAG: hypothetical protein HC884_19950 [Chloroflexaceae bacterium]|nr:hypothetical protein [Chloroflexaceae bacterium]
MVGFDTGPQPIPPAVIEALHEVQRRAQHRGVPHQSVGCPDGTEHPKQESLRGFAGVFQGNGGADERVQVFIEFLGRLKKAQPAVDATDTTGEIEIGAAPAPQRPRRTRGKGRKINHQQPQQDQLLRNCDGNETVG